MPDLPWRSIAIHVLDLVMITVLIYEAYALFRGTRAIRVLVGIFVLAVAYFVARFMGLLMTSWLLQGVVAVSLLSLIVIFQQEVRLILERISRPGKLFTRKVKLSKPFHEQRLQPIADALFRMAGSKTGALVVFERRELVEPLMRSTGVLLDAEISSELIEALFNKASPLHDGAVYIRNGKAYRASCVLPLPEETGRDFQHGTRHRAAIGVSQESDALVVVVSEESGQVSVVEGGTLRTVSNSPELLNWLSDRLGDQLRQRPGKRTLVSWILRDWRPKLTILAGVTLIWFLVVQQQNTEVSFSVPLVYQNVPKNLSIEGGRVQQANVTVQGPKEIINFLDPTELRVSLDLSEAQAGSNTFTIKPGNINLPLGLNVLELDPEQVELVLKEKEKEKEP